MLEEAIDNEKIMKVTVLSNKMRRKENKKRGYEMLGAIGSKCWDGESEE